MNLKQERKLWKKGFRRVACLDESGRGPLAGPIVAAAAVMMKNPKSEILISKQIPIRQMADKSQIPKLLLREVKDSKKISAKKREEIFEIIKNHPQIEWGIGRVSEKVIDRINILEATKLAMIKAVKNLEKKLSCISHDRKKRSIIDFLILDGNFSLSDAALAKAGINLPLLQKPIVEADNKVFSCSAASIIAKVSRDRMMKRYHKKYPKYGFDKHKGYPTKAHLRALKKYGLCKIHRKTFRPIRTLLPK